MPDSRKPPLLPFSERLRFAIDTFLQKSGVTPTEFGVLVMNDRSLYTRIKRGRPINSDTIDAIERLIATYEYPKPKRRAKKA